MHIRGQCSICDFSWLLLQEIWTVASNISFCYSVLSKPNRTVSVKRGHWLKKNVTKSINHSFGHPQEGKKCRMSKYWLSWMATQHKAFCKHCLSVILPSAFNPPPPISLLYTRWPLTHTISVTPPSPFPKDSYIHLCAAQCIASNLIVAKDKKRYIEVSRHSSAWCVSMVYCVLKRRVTGYQKKQRHLQQ